MDRIESVDNLFHEGNPSTGTKGTKVTDSWLNGIQEEPATVIEAAGLALDGNDYTQLLKAILILASGGIGGNKVITNASSPYSVKVSDGILLVDCTDGPVVVQFLNASLAVAKRITVKKIDDTENAVQCTPQETQTVEGEAGSYDSVMPGEFMSFIPDGSAAWHRVG